MGLKRWTGGNYADVVPRNVRTIMGDNPPKAAYVWDGSAFVKVWPTGVVNVQYFPRTANGYWSGFNAATGSSTNAREAAGGAGLVAIGMNATANTFQMFERSVSRDDQYLEVTLRSPVNGTLDTGASGSPMYLRLRCTSPLWAVGTGVEIMLRASGAVAISSFNGSTITARSSTSGTGRMSAGDVIRVEAQGNTYRVLNKTKGTSLCTWGDSTNIVPRTGRYAGMTQTANYPFFQQMYSCFSISRWEFGDM